MIPCPNLIRLDNFPGGAEIFNLLADYFYSIPISIYHKNFISLHWAECFVECVTLGTLLDKRFNEILLVARAKHDFGNPLVLLEQRMGEYEQWTKQAHIVNKCLEYVVQSFARGGGLKLSMPDCEIIVRLSLEWIVDLIKLCPAERKLSILPFVKNFVTIHVLE